MKRAGKEFLAGGKPLRVLAANPSPRSSEPLEIGTHLPPGAISALAKDIFAGLSGTKDQPECSKARTSGLVTAFIPPDAAHFAFSYNVFRKKGALWQRRRLIR